jgi:hypothetical protein
MGDRGVVALVGAFGHGRSTPVIFDMAGRTEISPLQTEFLEWLLTPSEGRQPTSQNEWARQHNVATQTVARWKTQDALFKGAWEKRLAEMSVGPERLQVILDALFAAASKGDVQAAKAYIAWVEKISPPRVTDSDAVSIEDLTDEELAELVEHTVTLRRNGTLSAIGGRMESADEH